MNRHYFCVPRRMVYVTAIIFVSIIVVILLFAKFYPMLKVAYDGKHDPYGVNSDEDLYALTDYFNNNSSEVMSIASARHVSEGYEAVILVSGVDSLSVANEDISVIMQYLDNNSSDPIIHNRYNLIIEMSNMATAPSSDMFNVIYYINPEQSMINSVKINMLQHPLEDYSGNEYCDVQSVIIVHGSEQIREVTDGEIEILRSIYPNAEISFS